jgi:O-antigen/teichoic acid export membrane protein
MRSTRDLASAVGGDNSSPRRPSGRFARLFARIAATLPKGGLLRGFAVLASGTAASQVIVVLSSPVLTRLYSPSDFGALSIYIAALSMLTMLAGLRYQLAIPLPRSDGSAVNVLALALTLTCVVAAVTAAIVISPLGAELVTLANAPQLQPYLWLLPVGVLLCGAYDVLTYWAIRKKEFGRIARTKLQQGIGSVGTQVVMGFAQFGALGLIVGHVVGNAAGLTRLVLSSLRIDAGLLERIRLARVLSTARRFRRFPLYFTWAGMAQIAGAQLPVLLFAAIFSPAMAGLYLLADRVTRAPLDLVGKATAQASFAGAAEARREGRLDRTALRTFEALTRVSVGPALLLAIGAPQFFGAAFGSDWVEAGAFVQWMTPMLIAAFIVAPLTVLHSVMERQGQALGFHTTLLLVRLIAMGVGVQIGQQLATVALFSLLSAVVYGLFGLWMLKTAGLSPWTVLKVFLREVVIVAPVAGAIWLLKMHLLNAQPATLPVDGTILLFIVFAVALTLVVSWRALPILKVRG